jgi:hypothetical protein
MFQLKSSIPIGAEVEISPLTAFTLGVKAEIGKEKFQSAPKLLINAEFYGPVLVPSSAFFFGEFSQPGDQKKKKKKQQGWRIPQRDF